MSRTGVSRNGCEQNLGGDISDGNNTLSMQIRTSCEQKHAEDDQ